MTPRRVWIGLGANLGDAAASVRRAIARLADDPAIRVVGASGLYETAPWGDPDQPWYVNAVVEAETALAPEQLLERLLEIERRLGRVRTRRWGPRTIDLDYLLDEAERRDTAGLRLPHPELENRAFVLAPLAELRPELVLPGGAPIGRRLAELLPDQPLRRREGVLTIGACPPS